MPLSLTALVSVPSTCELQQSTIMPSKTRENALALAAAAVPLSAATGRTLAGVPLSRHPFEHLNSIVAALTGLLVCVLE